MAGSGLVAQPADLQLETFVAQVAGHSLDIYQLVFRDVGYVLGTTLGEDDVLDGVEAESALANVGASILVAILSVETGQLRLVVHGVVESGFI